MADESNDSGEKTEEPSLQRIEEFRKRGEVASSKELASILILSASLMTLGLSLVYIYEVMSEYVHWIYGLSADSAFTEKSFKTIVAETMTVVLKSTGPILLVVFCVSILAHVVQIGFLFSTEVLELKLERINPLKGIKKIFSMRSIVEAVKGIFKFVFIMSIVYYFMKDDMNSYQGFFHVEAAQAFLKGKDILIKLSFSIILGLFIVAVGDFAYQKFSYKKKLMQTKEQAKKEQKEKDGSPEVRQKIRSIQREMATKRMMADIPKADVIVTNPTHISIVIQYDQETMISPTIIGKGADHLALRIREIAKEHNIPIVENVPLARAIYKTVKVGQAVPRTLYKAVAEVLAFVYKLKRKEKALG